MPSFKDLTGNKYGKLTVLRRNGTASNGNARWECLCECGKITAFNGDQLRAHKILSCGCGKEKDFTGQQFGRLTVLKRISPKYSTHKVVEYQCKCSCGNTVIVKGSNLSSGNTKSCGCYHIQRLHEDLFEDLTNKRFGRLLALYPINKYEHGVKKWHCICDCGNEVDVIAGNLTRGNSQSCGCLQLSHGAYKIEALLKENNIDFVKEYTFDNLVSDSGKKLRYDFAIIKNGILQYLIEFDGLQHYIPNDFFGGIKEMKKRQLHDKRKNKMAINNNIPLIRIPYFHEQSLTIEDLLVETSKYIVTNDIAGGKENALVGSID